MIKLHNLVKIYQTEEVETSALDNINIEIEAGEFLAIMGPSGCGKSTLLNIIGMLDSPNSGQYYFGATDIAAYSESQLADIRKSNIGIIFQSFNLIDELTVAENIEIALLYNNIPSAERKQRIQQVMEKMNISHRANHMPAQLSGGQQQRVAVARALVARPKVILADEPTGNLDSVHGEEVMEMLKKLNDEGATIIMVTHSPRDAAYANRVINLLDGQVAKGDETAPMHNVFVKNSTLGDNADTSGIA